MGLFDRTSVVVKANLNEMIKQAENPEKVLEQVINSIQEVLIQTKIAIAKVESIPNQKAKINYDVATAEVTKWEENLRKAEKANNEYLTFYARERLKNHKISAKIASQKIDENTGKSDTLKNNLVSLEKKLSEVKSLKDNLYPSNRLTKLFSPNSSDYRFSNIEMRLQNLQLELETTRQRLFDQQETTTKLINSNCIALKEVKKILADLNGNDQEKNIEQLFSSLESDSDTEHELSFMKELLTKESVTQQELTKLKEETPLPDSEVDDELETLRKQLDNL
ncbi:MAG: PspA/IM30 family protein [Symploca sp. SIO2C1]|nr:PspA/IM30 family protein [Symploca sp. SIO2C1]